MPKVPAYLTAELDSSAPRTIGNSADLLAQSVAERIREMLGTHPDSLPRGEPRITWRGLGGLTLTIRKASRLTIDTVWTKQGLATPDSLERAGTRLIARALQDVRDQQGEPFFLWPDSSVVDSLNVELKFVRSSVDADGKITPYSRKDGRVAFLVFYVQAPREAGATAVRGNPFPRYPERAKKAGVEATIRVQFVIDTTGSADPATITELWPNNVPRLAGDKAMYYRTFLTAVLENLPRMRFRPAEIGGCKVRVLVQQPFVFAIGH